MMMKRTKKPQLMVINSPNDYSALVTNVTLGDSALGDMGTFFGLGAAEFDALSSAALEYYEVNSDTSEEE